MINKPSDFGGLCFSRVVVVGANGAGKTWMARQLAARLDARVICKDALALTTRWQQRPRSAVQAEISRAITAERWVLEGGPSILLDAVLARAEMVVWLDMPAGLRLRRILWRNLRYFGRTRPEHPPGNRGWPGVRQVRFAWRAVAEKDRFAAAVEGALAGTSVPAARLRSRSDVAAFLAEMDASTHPMTSVSQDIF